jgi:NADH-quinone oxidoreductase subunit M
MMGVIALLKDSKRIKQVMAVGATIQLLLSFVLLVKFLDLRAAGDTAEMLFTSTLAWYEGLNISLSCGVDGISVLMIILSAIIVFTFTATSDIIFLF